MLFSLSYNFFIDYNEAFMKEKLELILNNATQEINCATSVQALDDVKLKYLSRKGELNSIKKNLKDLSDDDKRIVGAFANNVSNQLEQLLEEKGKALYKQELNKKLQEEVNEYLEEENIEEMVDILEVIRAILDHYNVTYEEIEEKRVKKAKKRGAFKEKIFLEKVIQNGD